MDLNLIVKLDCSKNQFNIEWMRLNENDSVRYVFEYADQPIDQHPVLFSQTTVKKLTKKSQVRYVTVSGFKNVAEYYDFETEKLKFNDQLLVPLDDKPTGTSAIYSLDVHPKQFLQSLQTAEFKKLQQSEKSERLFSLISEDCHDRFRSFIPDGFDSLSAEFIKFYEPIYNRQAKSIFFSTVEENDSLAKFIQDKIWYFTAYHSVDFDSYYRVLVDNFFSDQVRIFMANYSVSDSKSLLSTARLYDKLYPPADRLLPKPNFNQNPTKKPANPKESPPPADTTPINTRCEKAAKKYTSTIRSIASGGYNISSLSRSTSFARELLGDSCLSLKPAVREEEQMQIEPSGDQNWTKNIVFALDSNKVPLLNAGASREKGNAKRGRPKKVNKDAPLDLKTIKKTSADPKRKKTNQLTVVKRKLSPKLGYFNPYATLTAYVSPLNRDQIGAQAPNGSRSA